MFKNTYIYYFTKKDQASLFDCDIGFIIEKKTYFIINSILLCAKRIMNLIVFNLVCNVDPFPEISFHAFLRPKGQFLNLAQNALCENVRHFDEESLIV